MVILWQIPASAALIRTQRVLRSVISFGCSLMAFGGGVCQAESFVAEWRPDHLPRVRSSQLATPAETAPPVHVLWHRAAVSCLAWAPDNESLATGEAGRIGLWDTHFGELKRSYRTQRTQGKITNYALSTSLAFSGRGHLVLVGVPELDTRFVSEVPRPFRRLFPSEVLLLDASSMMLEKRFVIQQDVTCVRFSTEGATIAVASRTAAIDAVDAGAIVIQPIPAGQQKGIPCDDIGGVVAMEVSGDGRSMVIGGPEGMKVLSASDNKPKWKRTDITPRYLACSSNATVIAIGTGASSVSVLDGVTGKTARTLLCARPVGVLAMSHDGQNVAGSSADGTICIWDVLAGRVVRFLSGHTRPITCMAMCPNGLFLATGSADATVRIFSVERIRTQLKRAVQDKP